MFDTVQPAPPDAILGITEAFNRDPNPAKINLSVGVYKDASGQTPVLSSVKAAEERILKGEASKNYAPIDGAPLYATLVQQMLFGPNAQVLADKRSATAHTPGGTGALRVAGDLLKKLKPGATLWMSEPTWPNHPQIFQAAGLKTATYPYFDAKTNSLDWEPMLQALKAMAPGDIVLLHGCCHNPTGADPTAAQWKAIGDVVEERKLLALVDFAYQGFAQGLREDAACLGALLRPNVELMVCSSFSKNFGLYNERVGALTLVANKADAAVAVQSHVKSVIRSNYSNPPAHGGAIVSTILSDASLRSQWEQELTTMRTRIADMRELFVKTLAEKGVSKDMSFITRQNGMFSFSGLSKDQVERLKKDYAIYIVGSGRINVAGMTRDNMATLCTAIAAVMK